MRNCKDREQENQAQDDKLNKIVRQATCVNDANWDTCRIDTRRSKWSMKQQPKMKGHSVTNRQNIGDIVGRYILEWLCSSLQYGSYCNETRRSLASAVPHVHIQELLTDLVLATFD